RKGENPVTLDPEHSAALREKLLTELGTITSADLAAAWAVDALPAKNTLTATDAKLVEDAFERGLSELASSDATAPSNADASVSQIAAPKMVASSESTDAGEARGTDKSTLTVATPRRYRNREHLRYVAQQACLVCGRKPSDPHHLRYLQPRALGRKAIIAPCTAPATSRPGGRRLASIPLMLPARSGNKPGSMIAKSIAWRIS